MDAPADPEQVETVLAAWGTRLRIGDRLGGGNRNAVWRVVIDRTPYAPRRSRRPTAALDWELDLLAYLRRHGLRVPAILPTPDGRRHVAGLVLFEWLDGDPPATERDWRLVEQTLRDLHRLTGEWPQRPSFRATQDLLHEDRGGDVRLDVMSAEAVRRCRAAWRCLAGAPVSVVHGDPGASNIRISAAGAGLLDWDEARVDAAVLDLAALPVDQIDGITPERLALARTALDAWEAANGWLIEPAYARRRLRALP